MTICIGAICDNRKSVIVAADRMMTSGSPRVEFEHPASKIDELTDHCVLMSAGQVLPATKMFSRVKEKIIEKENLGISLIAEMVKESYGELLEEAINDQLLKSRGLKVKDLYLEGRINRLPEKLAMLLDQNIATAKMDLALIVAGVDNKGSQIYGINHPGVLNSFDKVGYHAIGSGNVHALSAFIFDRHSVDFDMKKSLYICYEAKRRAEVAPGVGSETNMAVITSEGVRFLTTSDINKLSDIYDKINAPRISELDTLISEFKLDKKSQKAEVEKSSAEKS